MHRKQFEWFASWLDQYPNLLMDYDALDDLMSFFEACNPAFDHRRFLLASGFTEDEVVDIWGFRKEK